MKRREFGERWSFIWLVIVTIDIIAGALMIRNAIHESVVEQVQVEVEKFTTHSVKAAEYHGSKHVEELETGILIDEKSLEILSRIIHGESGSNWCSDQMQLYVGSVFLNRVASEHFPNTFEEVAFQEGQYSCTKQGSGYWQEPTERDIANARYLLEKGSLLPVNVLFQSQFKQADGVYAKVGNQYFCYKGEKP